jgi:hypothetical protein
VDGSSDVLVLSFDLGDDIAVGAVKTLVLAIKANA